MNLPEIEQLFKDYYQALHRYAFTILKNEEDASDVVQSVFINIWEKKDSIEISVSPKSYLFRSVYNESLNFIKKENTRQKHEIGAAPNPMALTEEPAKDEEQNWQQKIDKVLDLMPEQCRKVFMKSRIEGKKYAEIAAELDISIKTVEAHMSKALKIVRTSIGVLILMCCLSLELIK